MTSALEQAFINLTAASLAAARDFRSFAAVLDECAAARCDQCRGGTLEVDWIGQRCRRVPCQGRYIKA